MTVKKFIKNMLLFILISIFVVWISFIWLFYHNIIKDLPDISNINNMSFNESTLITDQNWEYLYKLFDENREFVEYNKISKHVIDWIISVEDSNFWTNKGYDVIWIIRAWVNNLSYKFLWKTFQSQGQQWWSTITQQLVKNLFLTKEQTITRKLKELVLTIKLDSYLNSIIPENTPNFQIKKKEKIMEMYLNYIFLWNNSYGIQAASKTYFNKDAKDLSIVESAILAWIPKAPSTYNPITKRKNIIWELIITNLSWDKIQYSWNINEVQLFEQDIFNKDINFLNTFILEDTTLKYWSWENQLSFKYWQGRKDHVLKRMFNLWYINEWEYKEAFISWFNLELYQEKTTIVAPHFVWYVKDYIENSQELKNLWITEENLWKWWYTITTSLDLKIQKKAESVLKNNRQKMNEQWANNSSLIYSNSNNWDILAYVWSHDYYNKEIEWENDMLRSLRQPWSSIKPFIYAWWFINNPFTIDQPILDSSISFGNYKPNNADWSFQWLMSAKNALAWSRNIPSIKMYFAWWEEQKIIPFLNNIWLNSLDVNHNYWYSLSLWWWEVKYIELAQAYNDLSNLWEHIKINPIVQIRDNKGKIIYDKNFNLTQRTEERYIPKWVAYMIWEMLSNPQNMPSSWATKFKYTKVKWAHKSWTSDMKTDKWQFPRDGLLATYTPERTLILWWGNTDWSPMKKSTYWWWLNVDTFKDFSDEMVALWDLKDTNFEKPDDVIDYNISLLNWLLASKSTPSSFIRKTIWWSWQQITWYDWTKFIQIDKNCWWKISENTLENDKVEWLLLHVKSIMPNKQDLWSLQSSVMSMLNNSENNLFAFLSEPKEICNTNYVQDNNINLNLWSITFIENTMYIPYTIISDISLKNLQIISNNTLIYSNNLNNKTWVLKVKHNLNDWDSITIKVYNINWWFNSKNIVINNTLTDIESPKLLSKKLENNNWFYSLILTFSDNTKIAWWIIKYNWQTQKIKKSLWNSNKSINKININNLDMNVDFSVNDIFENNSNGSINISSLLNNEDIVSDDVNNTWIIDNNISDNFELINTWWNNEIITWDNN